MRRNMTLIWMVAMGVGLLADGVSAAEVPAIMTQKEKASYGIGVNVARNFQRQGIEVDVDLVIKGLKDAFSGQKLLISERELRRVLIMYQTELRRKQVRTKTLPDEVRKREGEVFLSNNKTKEGTVTLPTGLQYKILKAGEGRKPTDADTVEVNYRGTLIDGIEFDSSQPGQPATFKVKGDLIPGWAEALKLMPVGSRWQLVIPPQLAYGEQGAENIGPNEVLILDVELVAIK